MAGLCDRFPGFLGRHPPGANLDTALTRTLCVRENLQPYTAARQAAAVLAGARVWWPLRFFADCVLCRFDIYMSTPAKPVPHQRTIALVNAYIVHTARLLSDMSAGAGEKLQAVSNRCEITLPPALRQPLVCWR